MIHGHRRSHARRGKLFARVVGHRDLPDAPDSADLIVDDPALARAFATLTAREQEAIALVAWEHLDLCDAARAAGCSEATFAVRYSRARTRLAAALDLPRLSPKRSIAAASLASPTRKPIGEAASAGR